MAAEFRIVSWNLLHSTGAEAGQVADLALSTKADLLLMQEAGASMDVLPERLGGCYARVALPGRRHGLAAWSPLAFASKADGMQLQRGLIVRRLCQILDFGAFAVANVHLSHGQLLNRRQLRRIALALPERAAIIGDCNMVGAAMLPGFRDAGARHCLPAGLDILGCGVGKAGKIFEGFGSFAEQVFGIHRKEGHAGCREGARRRTRARRLRKIEKFASEIGSFCRQGVK